MPLACTVTALSIIIFRKRFRHHVFLYIYENMGNLSIPNTYNFKCCHDIIMIWLLLYLFLNLNYSELNLVKSPVCTGKVLEIITVIHFSSVRNIATLLKLLTKCKIKCYCSYYNLFLELLFIHRFFSFGVILCFEGFFPRHLAS